MPIWVVRRAQPVRPGRVDYRVVREELQGSVLRIRRIGLPSRVYRTVRLGGHHQRQQECDEMRLGQMAARVGGVAGTKAVRRCSVEQSIVAIAAGLNARRGRCRVATRDFDLAAPNRLMGVLSPYGCWKAF